MDLDKPFRIFHTDMTLREYFGHLLETLWVKQEMFSGKRPFGNSGWDFELYAALIEADMMEGRLDEDGDLDEIDEEMAHDMILSSIRKMRNGG